MLKNRINQEIKKKYFILTFVRMKNYTEIKIDYIYVVENGFFECGNPQ